MTLIELPPVGLIQNPAQVRLETAVDFRLARLAQPYTHLIEPPTVA
jgi:hypothetical protein